MRIRKRLASSSLPTTPHLSDPPSDPPNHPSDHFTAIRRWVLSENDNTPEKMKNKLKELGDDDETCILLDQEKKSTSINHDIRKIVSILNEGGTNKIMQPSSPSAQGGFEGDNYEVVPLKKRKGGISNEENGLGAKKSKRGNVIMEGSGRCSRVNGRGWRCCHPTLVGYSLCEHHLGKGRVLRIMHHQDAGGSGGGGAMGGGENSREQQVAAVVFTKKRTKVGVVKARSMSSLLGQI